MYNQKLANVIDYLQAMDRNGTYHELWEEYQNGVTTLSDALDICKDILTNWYEEEKEEQYKSWIDYINY